MAPTWATSRARLLILLTLPPLRPLLMPLLLCARHASCAFTCGHVHMLCIPQCGPASQLELCGRAMNIGRPKGYVDPPQFTQQNKLSMAQMFAAQVHGCDCA